VLLSHERCAPAARSFCELVPAARASAGPKRLAYEGVPVTSDAQVARLIEDARVEVSPLASRALGTAEGQVRGDRISESPLANALTDSLRALSGAELSFMNTGGMRAPLPPGQVAYEDFYRTLPFNNHALVVGPMPASAVVALLERSVRTCGAFGALMQSGLKVAFERDCSRAVDGVDRRARLLRAETLQGEPVFDAEKGVLAPEGRVFVVATLDYLAAGGSGYGGFAGSPLIRDLGIVREAMVERFLKEPFRFTAATDGRWKEQAPAR
jgi:2',3'-cyclic-nucleotide 2'-phosphodiesterase (5'-nucleotidase family)